MNQLVLIDRAALGNFRLLRLARQRSYYLAEPPALGIVVVHKFDLEGIRTEIRIEDLVGLTAQCAYGTEPGVAGWCSAGYEGRLHGKLTLFKTIEQEHTLTLSDVYDIWREKYPM